MHNQNTLDPDLDSGWPKSIGFGPDVLNKKVGSGSGSRLTKKTIDPDLDSGWPMILGLNLESEGSKIPRIRIWIQDDQNDLWYGSGFRITKKSLDLDSGWPNKHWIRIWIQDYQKDLGSGSVSKKTKDLGSGLRMKKRPWIRIQDF